MHKNFPNSFVFLDKYNSQIFVNKNIKIGVVYRNYNDSNRLTELKKIAKACKEMRYPLFVSNNINLALKVKADGIYVPSFNKTLKLINREKKNLLVIGSAHNQKEIYEKISQNCAAIFLSPVFKIEKTKNFLNLYKFNFLSNNNKINVLALGGITEKNTRMLKLLNIKGFGGIKIFKKKAGLKKPAFLKNNFF